MFPGAALGQRPVVRGYRVQFEFSRRERKRQGLLDQSASFRETRKGNLVAEVSGRCFQRALKRTPRFVGVIDERSVFGWLFFIEVIAAVMPCFLPSPMV